MEEKEEYLGEVTSTALARGMIRGYAIYVTNRRIIGVKRRRMAVEQGFGGRGLIGYVVERKMEKKEAAE